MRESMRMCRDARARRGAAHQAPRSSEASMFAVIREVYSSFVRIIISMGPGAPLSDVLSIDY